MATEGWFTVEVPVGLDEATVSLTARQLPLVRKLVGRLVGGQLMRWSTLRTLAKGGLDGVDVERAVLALHRAGWIEVDYRRDRKGDKVPRRLRILPCAADQAATYLGQLPPSERARILAQLLEALAQQRDLGRPPVPERVLVRRLSGSTKSIRVRDYQTELEASLGVPLDTLVRFHVDLALSAGPVSYRFRGTRVDLRGSYPWAAITQPVAEALEDLCIGDVKQIYCVENQTPFESLIYEGLAERSVLLFTSGYLGTVQRIWLRKLLDAGVERVWHWGDLDPWGLDIYRDLASYVRSVKPSADVRPWRMEPGPLSRPDTQKLTPADWAALHRYLKRPDAPLRATAEAMKRLGCKLEQEALLDPN